MPAIVSLLLLFSAVVQASVSLDSVCTSSYVKSNLPSNSTYEGVIVYSTDLTVSLVDSSDEYCEVIFTYTHDGRDDTVQVAYGLPAPADFENRYLATGGAGFAITNGATQCSGGVAYGAVGGTTDAGFGSFSTSSDEVFLLANGTIDYSTLFIFSYQAIHEMSILGKEFTRNFYNMSDDDTLYSYYSGCSEGGRDGWSIVQRFPDDFDGAAVGAPALRFSFQQIQHLYSEVVETTLDYYPPQSDLCVLDLDWDSIEGVSYSCSASGSTPAQTGTVTSEAIAVASNIYEGLHDSSGDQAYLSYRYGASFGDAETAYDSSTESWEVSVSSTGADFVQRYINLVNSTSLSLDDVTYDDLRDWMYTGWQRCSDTLETVWPDLTPFYEAGGKVLHYHGEADPSIPAGSSVYYRDSVRSVMYANLTYAEGHAALNDFYRLFLIPGAGHCGVNSAMPDGPWPETILETLIEWVEDDTAPSTLNGTVQGGDDEGDIMNICAWPYRPYWSDSSSVDPECVYEETSIDTWIYNFTSFPTPIY